MVYAEFIFKHNFISVAVKCFTILSRNLQSGQPMFSPFKWSGILTLQWRQLFINNALIPKTIKLKFFNETNKNC